MNLSHTIARSRSLDYLQSGSATQFIRALSTEALAHPATGHEYLTRFSEGNFPDMDAAVKDYALQYYCYSAGFTSYLLAVINGLSEQRHKDVLLENLEEEQGQDEDNHIPHTLLFERFRRAAGVSDKDEQSPCTTAIVWRDLFLQKCQSRELGVGLGAIGIATEMIVSRVYEQLLNGIRDHTSISPDDYIFFDLHVECDDEHAEKLIEITAEIAETSNAREAIRFGVISSLNLRCAFWDVMLSRAMNGAYR